MRSGFLFKEEKMLKKLMLFLFILGFGSPIALSCEPPKGLSDEICVKTSSYYKRLTGKKRSIEQFKPFIKAGFEVADMFPMFPGENKFDRVLRLYCYGGQESIYNQNFININVPYASYGSLKVRKFSVDYGWIGINEANIDWVYHVALAIQQEKPVPVKYTSTKLRKALDGACIPAEIKLKQISNIDSKKLRVFYQEYKRRKYSPNKIRGLLNNYPHEYREVTQDEITSLLIYRAIIEIDRSTRDWNYKTWDKDLYKSLRHSFESYY